MVVVRKASRHWIAQDGKEKVGSLGLLMSGMLGAPASFRATPWLAHIPGSRVIHLFSVYPLKPWWADMRRTTPHVVLDAALYIFMKMRFASPMPPVQFASILC